MAERWWWDEWEAEWWRGEGRAAGMSTSTSIEIGAGGRARDWRRRGAGEGGKVFMREFLAGPPLYES